MFSTLPEQVQAKILPGSLGDLGEGRLRNQLLRVVTVDAAVAYLKVGTGEAAVDIREEAVRLRWIGMRLPVPRVLLHCSEANADYLLISELRGKPSHEWVKDAGPQRVVECLASALRQVHALPIADCPFDSVLDDELAESERRIRERLLDEEAFANATGEGPPRILAELRSQRGMVRDLVFTHGDYALPNVVLEGTTQYGILDWGIAGVADRHRDFMCVEKSITRNCGPDWVHPFYDAYGESEIDRERIRFYWLLDQFFAHYTPKL